MRARKFALADVASDSPGGLQRSRARESAEIHSPCPTQSTPKRFNGAAPVRARTSGHFPPVTYRHVSFNGAAPVRARKYFIGSALFSCEFLLQRSRARESAEIGDSRRQGMNSMTRFNGAAPVRARKLSNLHLLKTPTACFNGAAPVRARKLDQLENLRMRHLSFNGAAPVRARK